MHMKQSQAREVIKKARHKAGGNLTAFQMADILMTLVNTAYDAGDAAVAGLAAIIERDEDGDGYTISQANVDRLPDPHNGRVNRVIFAGIGGGTVEDRLAKLVGEGVVDARE